MKHSFLVGELVLSGLVFTTSALPAQNPGKPSRQQCEAATQPGAEAATRPGAKAATRPGAETKPNEQPHADPGN